MIRQLSTDGLTFRTPKFENLVQAVSDYSRQRRIIRYVVTKESTLRLNSVQVGAHFSNVTVDVLGYVENVPFVIYVTYQDRSVPTELKPPATALCGIVELNVNALPGLFKQEKSGQYIEVLRRYIEEQTDGKSWVFHPREIKQREAAMAELQRWQAEQRLLFNGELSHRHSSPTPSAPVSAKSKLDQVKDSEPVVQNYTCVICKGTWTGSSRICRNCNTHLYTKLRQ